jgi:hypothetical protein
MQTPGPLFQDSAQDGPETSEPKNRRSPIIPRKYEYQKRGPVLIKALIDQFLITRYEAATLVAKSKLAALETLVGRMPNMSDNILIKTIETLSQIAEVDISAITDSGELKR